MIRKVWLKEFRNIDLLTLDLSNHAHCYIVGNNNQGKTSILEAIYLVLKHDSPLEEAVTQLIQYKKTSCMVGVDLDSNIRLYCRIKQSGEKEFTNTSTKDTKQKANKRLIEYISADVLHVFQKDPAYRRKQLDRFCSEYDTNYRQVLRQYERLLRQKNKALKHEKTPYLYIDTLNKALVPLATDLYDKRHLALVACQQKLNSLLPILAHLVEDIDIVYLSTRIECNGNASYGDMLYKQMVKDYEKEKILGYSLSGPHRDDFGINLNEKPIFTSFSRGVNRSVALLLRLAQMELLKAPQQEACLLLDDAFVEIDHANKKRLIIRMSQKLQLIYATTTQDDYNYFSNCSFVKIEDGRSVDG